MVKASRLTQPLAGAQGNGVKSLYCEHISRGHNSIIPSMVGSNARYISQDVIGIPVRKKNRYSSAMFDNINVIMTPADAFNTFTIH